MHLSSVLLFLGWVTIVNSLSLSSMNRNITSSESLEKVPGKLPTEAKLCIPIEVKNSDKNSTIAPKEATTTENSKDHATSKQANKDKVTTESPGNKDASTDCEPIPSGIDTKLSVAVLKVLATKTLG
ncbi:uncharacterized protein Dana_GF27606 [Drosophila ananassae]|uniref:Acp54A1 n=1 Tax=Drosophila ananassae TaxID=7217 RepID=A0A0P8ZZM4_DROAN|nr:uncharacterized protein LOC26515015 [Drosophila ananassae]KPU80045.1 uncharacterized protein Dana_GF27606 [Drosophila ananassae]